MPFRFVIISGHLSYNSLEPIFEAFNSQNKFKNTEIVLMDTKFPELDGIYCNNLNNFESPGKGVFLKINIRNNWNA